MEKATLGGGASGVWTIYDALKGVQQVIPGYAGGDVPQPSYEQVCTGRTGHAGSRPDQFDPAEIDYRELLHIFTIHDPIPSTGGRGRRDAVSPVTSPPPEQHQIAEEVIAEVAREGLWRDPIVTQLVPYTEFYPAEEYHHRYFERNPHQGYCRVVIAPKVAKFRQKYMERLKA